MARAKRIWRESQHPRDGKGRFARRGGAAWVKRAAAEISSLAGEAGNATRGEGGRPRISRNAKAGAVLQAHTDGGRPSAVRVPQATVTQRPSPAGLAAFNAPDAPAAPKKRMPRQSPGAAALIAARANEQAPHVPAMVAARTTPEAAPVQGAEAYAAMRRHTLLALARDAKISIRGKSNTQIANELAEHDAKVKADRAAKLNPGNVGGQVDTPRVDSQDGGMTSTTPRPFGNPGDPIPSRGSQAWNRAVGAMQIVGPGGGPDRPMTPYLNRAPEVGDTVTAGGLNRKGTVVRAIRRNRTDGFDVQWEGEPYTRHQPGSSLGVVDVPEVIRRGRGEGGPSAPEAPKKAETPPAPRRLQTFSERMAGDMSESDRLAARLQREEQIQQIRAREAERAQQLAEARANDTRPEREKLAEQLQQDRAARDIGMRSGRLDPQREARIKKLEARLEELDTADRKAKIKDIKKGDKVKTPIGEFEVVGKTKDGYLRVLRPDGRRGNVDPKFIEAVTPAPKAEAAQVAAPARARISPDAKRGALARLDTARDKSQNGGMTTTTNTPALPKSRLAHSQDSLLRAIVAIENEIGQAPEPPFPLPNRPFTSEEQQAMEPWRTQIEAWRRRADEIAREQGSPYGYSQAGDAAARLRERGLMGPIAARGSELPPITDEARRLVASTSPTPRPVKKAAPTGNVAPVGDRPRTGTYTGDIQANRAERLNNKEFTDHVTTLTLTAHTPDEARGFGFAENDEPVQVGDEVMIWTFGRLRRGIVTGTTRGGGNGGTTRVAYNTPTGENGVMETTNPTAGVLRLVDPSRRPGANRAALLPRMAPEPRARPTAEDRAKAAEVRKAEEKSAAAARRQRFFDEKINGIMAALNGELGSNTPEWHLQMTTEEGLVSLAKHLGVKVPNREKNGMGYPKPRDRDKLITAIIDAVRARRDAEASGNTPAVGAPKRGSIEAKIAAKEKEIERRVGAVSLAREARSSTGARIQSGRESKANAALSKARRELAALQDEQHRAITPGGTDADVEAAIRQAYAKIAGHVVTGDSGYVKISDVRQALGDRFDRQTIDRVLDKMIESPDVALYAEPQPAAITPADRADAVSIGGENRHIIRIGSTAAARNGGTGPGNVPVGGTDADRRAAAPRMEGETDRAYAIRTAPSREAAVLILNGYSVAGLRALALDEGTVTSGGKPDLVARLIRVMRDRHADSQAITDMVNRDRTLAAPKVKAEDLKTGDMVQVGNTWGIVKNVQTYRGTDLPTEVQVSYDGGARVEWVLLSTINAHEARRGNVPAAGRSITPTMTGAQLLAARRAARNAG